MEFQQLAAMDSRVHAIIERVSAKAQGVWLWVYLVVRMLLADLEGDETFDTLNRTVDELPPDIEEFLGVMLQRLDRRHSVEAHRLLLLACTANIPIPAYGLHFFLENQSASKYVASAIKPDSPFPERDLDLLPLRNRLNNRCKDLLELDTKRDFHSSFRLEALERRAVIFLHRCVRDYLNNEYPAVLQSESKVGADFHPDEFLCSMMVALFKERYRVPSLLTDLALIDSMNTSYLKRFRMHATRLDSFYEQKLRCFQQKERGREASYAFAGYHVPMREIELHRNLSAYAKMVDQFGRAWIRLVSRAHLNGANAWKEPIWIPRENPEDSIVARLAIISNLGLYVRNVAHCKSGIVSAALLDFALRVSIYRRVERAHLTNVVQDGKPIPSLFIALFESNSREWNRLESGFDFTSKELVAEQKVMAGDFEMVEFLLQKGISPNDEVESPFIRKLPAEGLSGKCDGCTYLPSTLATPWKSFLRQIYDYWVGREVFGRVLENDSDWAFRKQFHDDPFNAYHLQSAFNIVKLLLEHGADTSTQIDIGTAR
ncbi:hypothetical protein BJ508DRAFT_117631 [Ascobolus immersus RN42]|uniref:DUF7791 domain-containing protein n=1 Tax=Ascobolus immersus RN42 TaxID=1160509 RepID=A0A3N4I6B2_ASCIM|nr:hypothetical protein BJ508DRAFT_117631 [Ascobolus immersus RN42]